MTDPKEQTDDLLREAAHGRSERTPWLGLGGVHVVVIAIVAVVLAIVFTVYLIA